MSNETIAVKWPDGPYEYKLIDKDDYDPEVHEMHEIQDTPYKQKEQEAPAEVVAEQNPEVTTEQEEPDVVKEVQEAAPANRKGKRN